MSTYNKTIPYSLGPVLEYTLKTLQKFRAEQTKRLLPTPARPPRAGSSSSDPRRPMVIGITGPQGLGKSTLAEALQDALESPAHGALRVQRFSLDDVYLTHGDQRALSAGTTARAPRNPLLQNRGQPGTHDLALCLRVLDGLCGPRGQRVQVPVYDKAAFGGEGDRAFEGLIPAEGSGDGDAYLDVVIFEGWCVGFQSLGKQALEAGIRERLPATTSSPSSLFSMLAQHPEYLEAVDRRLAEYQQVWDYFDVFVHLDAGDIDWVYDWRLQQEHELIRAKGKGKTDDQVREFINSYMSSYYLYVPNMRAYMATSAAKSSAPRVTVPLQRSVGKNVKGHIRLVVNKSREIAQVISNGFGNEEKL